MRVAYFKINKQTDYLLPCLQSWIDVFKLDKDVIIIFVCDKADLKSYVESQVDLSSLKCEWISSYREDPELKPIVEASSVEGWFNAGYAHLTPFKHARDHGFTEFWNIDADDMRFFAEPEKVLQILSTVEKVAHDNDIKIFSNDIWTSLSLVTHWSFGITFVNNFNFIHALNHLLSHSNIAEDYKASISDGRNMDWFFTYLRWRDASIKIETFYIENLRFVHFYQDIYSKNFLGTRYVSNGIYHFPMLADVFGLKDAANIPVDKNNYKIDVGLTAEDSYNYLESRCNFKGVLDDLRTLATVKNIDVKISVVIDSKGQDMDFQLLLNSLQAQTYKNFEVICINPTTTMSLICRGVKYFFPGGIKIADNKLIPCRGKYVVNLIGNEVLPQNYFENLIKDAE